MLFWITWKLFNFWWGHWGCWITLSPWCDHHGWLGIRDQLPVTLRLLLTSPVLLTTTVAVSGRSWIVDYHHCRFCPDCWLPPLLFLSWIVDYHHCRFCPGLLTTTIAVSVLDCWLPPLLFLSWFVDCHHCCFCPGLLNTTIAVSGLLTTTIAVSVLDCWLLPLLFLSWIVDYHHCCFCPGLLTTTIAVSVLDCWLPPLLFLASPVLLTIAHADFCGVLLTLPASANNVLLIILVLLNAWRLVCCWPWCLGGRCPCWLVQ